MELDSFVARLYDASSEVQIARSRAMDTALAVVQAKTSLDSRKASATNSGKIDGPNETVRKAQLALFCAGETTALEKAEEANTFAQVDLENAQTTLDTIKYHIRLLEATKS